jgi:hypothetical protein
MATKEKSVRVKLSGFLYEGNACLIVKEYNPLKLSVVGETVESVLNEFIDKNVEITITINIYEKE